MKTTVDIPDDLYLRVKVQAAAEKRKVKDLVSEGLRMVLEVPRASTVRPRRMTKAPVTIKGRTIPALSNAEMARLLERDGEKLP